MGKQDTNRKGPLMRAISPFIQGFPRFFGLASVIVVCAAVAAVRAAESDEDFFEKTIRPILVANCLECHGDEEPEAGLRLTTREDLLRGGKSGPAAMERQPAESLLVQAVRQTGKLKMPPDDRLADTEIAALAQWVEMGLPWPSSATLGTRRTELVITEADRQHWSFRPVSNSAPPGVQDQNWPMTTIDHFVLAKLEEAGLKPAPAADRRTLLRRAYYDLIGLPPSWEEVQTFLRDERPTETAFAEVVDRLLASPRYGERWGRHWLDVARFADTKDGVLMYGDDRVRPFAYTYRDYVIRAFNADTPFDRFVHEQLAADLIQPPVEPWRLAALGFLTLSRQYDDNLHDVIDDRIDTMARGFLGLTVACARCHDHKYDPIPTADYYSLYGVFASSDTPLELPLIAEPAQIPGGAEFEQTTLAKRDELRKFVDEQFALELETARQRVGDYLVHVVTRPPDPLETAIYFLSLDPTDLRPPIIARWRRLLAQRATSDDPVFGPWQELLAEQATNDAQAFAKNAKATVERWSQRTAGTDVGQVNPLVREALSKATLSSPADVARVYGELLRESYERWKAASTATGTASPPIIAPEERQLLDLVIGQDSPLYFTKSQIRQYMSRQPKDAFGGKLQELDKMAVQSANAPPRAMVVFDVDTPFDPRIFVRGNPSQPGRHVPRQFLEILSSGDRQPFAHGSGRLDLAQAIASPDNPLTARVFVNRVWMHHFGEPLVASPSDFGKRSAPPVQAELLDHLASQFIHDGWSIKKLHRLMMASRVYQQSMTASPETATAAQQLDPDNRWLWKMPRRRLDFEALRDSLLSISGRLEHRDGGRPVDIANDPHTRCRTVYGLVDRQSLPGVFRAFDFAPPDQSVERRPRTMTPQQALFALNSPFMVEQARSLAARSAAGDESDSAARIAALFHAVYQREPTAEEVAASQAFVATSKDDASQLSNWEQLAQVLLSSNELMYLD